MSWNKNDYAVEERRVHEKDQHYHMICSLNPDVHLPVARAWKRSSNSHKTGHDENLKQNRNSGRFWLHL